MASGSPHKRNEDGGSPPAISPLPLPVEDSRADEPAQTHALPTGSNGKLSPAQRARLGLDVFGQDAAAAKPPSQSGTTDFGFAQMDPPAAAQPAPEEPRLAPVQSSAGSAAADRTAELRPAVAPPRRSASQPDAAPNPAPSARRDAQTVSERDGIPEVERDRAVLGYGVGWTIFCLLFAAVMSAINVTSGAGSGVNPGAFVPAVISIVMGWIIVAIGHRMRAWGWLMIVPAIVLVLGPFVYTTWRLGAVESSARAYLAPAAQGTPIDIDVGSVLSSTINTDQGCFALTIDRISGDVRIDAVTYAPATAQQQASMALAPRYARRVPAGGERALQRSFQLSNGKLPVTTTVLGSPSIDCALTSSQ